MPITKIGTELLKAAGTQNVPGDPGIGGKTLSAIGRFSMPLFGVGLPVMNIASGTSSVGEAVGESAGSLADCKAADHDRKHGRGVITGYTGPCLETSKQHIPCRVKGTFLWISLQNWFGIPKFEAPWPPLLTSAW